MFQVLTSSWALFLGMFMLMLGNGLQGTLLGVRGEAADFSTFEMSLVMSAYFLGFLGGSQRAPKMIQRVGHIRVFAALGSLISAVLILYPTFVEPVAWIIGRVIIGFCFSAVYVTAESWLNNGVDNANRGKALSLYMLVQMGGIVTAQYFLLIEDPTGFILFIIPSMLVSLSFAPILLTVSPTPAFETTKPMKLRELVRTSPLVSMGMTLLGGVYAAQFGMAAVFASRVGLGLGQISIFISSIYIAALVSTFPIGWLSDRMDRRLLIICLAFVTAAGAMIGFLFPGNFTVLLIAGALVGGASNPLYSLLLAYANDYLEREDMAAASAGYVFINGVGAIAGPVVIGLMMDAIGDHGFWLFIVVLMAFLGAYGIYRMGKRATPSDASETVSYATVMQSASPLAMELAQEVYIDAESEAEQSGRDLPDPD